MGKPKRLNLKPPGKCIFCGRGDMTKEHVFPDWLRTLFPRTEKTKHTKGFIEWGSAIAPQDKPKIITKSQPGHTGTTKVRVVCRCCNTGWLHNLEDATKPLLTQLILGQEINLSPAMQGLLSTWASKTVMTSEFVGSADPLNTLAQRQRLMQTLASPEEWCVFMAGYIGDSWGNLNFFQHQLGLQVPAVEGQEATIQHLRITTFGMGHVVFFVYGGTWNRMREIWGNYDAPGLRRLWPLSGRQMLWPPLTILGDAEINRIANLLTTNPEHAFNPDAYRAITA